VLCPAVAGISSFKSTAKSTSNSKIPSQPFAPGAANALSTTLSPVATTSLPSLRNETVPRLPDIGVFGSGGLVVPVVKFRVIGLLDEPI